MIRKLRHKFIVINMVFVSIVLLVVFLSLYLTNSIKFRDKSSEFLEGLVSRPIKVNMAGDKSPKDHDMMQLYAFTVVLDEDWNQIQLIKNVGDIDEETAKQAVMEVIAIGEMRGLVKELSLRYLVRELSNGYVIAFTDISKDIEYLTNLIRYSIIIAIGALTAFLIISVYLSKYTIRPVEKAWKKQQQFVADASHELKTPLTVILATTSILLKNKDTLDQKQEKWIKYIDSEASRMQDLVKDLLFLAKSDEAHEDIIKNIVNLNDIVENCMLLFEPVTFEAGLSLKHSVIGINKVNGNSDLLKQLIMILVDNAIKHSNNMGEVVVTLRPIAGKAILSVNNKGHIISKDSMEHIFDRFYKDDESRTSKTGSYGLGLSIAKEIINSHKGKITVTSNEEQGTTFTVVLSLA